MRKLGTDLLALSLEEIVEGGARREGPSVRLWAYVSKATRRSPKPYQLSFTVSGRPTLPAASSLRRRPWHALRVRAAPAVIPTCVERPVALFVTRANTVVSPCASLDVSTAPEVSMSAVVERGSAHPVTPRLLPTGLTAPARCPCPSRSSPAWLPFCDAAPVVSCPAGSFRHPC